MKSFTHWVSLLILFLALVSTYACRRSLSVAPSAPRPLDPPTATSTWTLTPSPTPTETWTGTWYTFTPTASPTRTPPCFPFNTFGKTTNGAYSVQDFGFLDATRYTLSEAATIFNLSVRLTSASGNVALALYADNAGTPSTLIVAAPAQPAVEGWNDLALPYTYLSAGDYWLTLQVQNATEVWFDLQSGAEYYSGFTFGAFPSTFPAGSFYNYTFALHADYCRDLSFPTLTPTMTGTPSPTPALVWTQVTSAAPFPARQSHASAVFDTGIGPRMWIIGGYDGGSSRLNDVWSSSDGISWSAATTAAAFPAREGHELLVHDDGTGMKLWVLGGWDGGTALNDVWNSSDGVTWNLVTASAGFTARHTHGAVVFDAGAGPRLWVIGGYDGTSVFSDVWSSQDGVNWTQVTADAGFAPRYHLSCAVYQNRIWMYGGGSGTTYYTDVWSSSDGNTWQQESATTPFPPRIGHVLTTHDSGSGLQLWVVSGYGGSAGFQTDVWSSSNGTNWVLVDADIPCGGRAGHTSLTFLGRLWVIAGFLLDTYYVTQDVWSAP